MIDYMIDNHSIDTNRIFITGVSAGGAMANAMMVTYPERFKAGGIIAGIPYGPVTDLATAYEAMTGQISLNTASWRKKIFQQIPDYKGRFPRIVIIHGKEDPVVNFVNSTHLGFQWIDLHNTRQQLNARKQFNKIPNVYRYEILDDQRQPLIVKYEIEQFAHGIPIDPGNTIYQGGEIGKYTMDIDFLHPLLQTFRSLFPQGDNPFFASFAMDQQ